MKATLGVYLNLNDTWREQLAQLSRDFPNIDIVLGKEQVVCRIAELTALVAVPMPEEELQRAEKLEALFVPFVGLNHLPHSLLTERGVRVFNVHGNAESVAERALALTLAYLGRVVELHKDLQDRELWHGFWARKGIEDGWSSLYRRPCTIFGTGAIGRELAKLLHAFGCHVTGYRRSPGLDVPAGFDAVAGSLQEAVAAGDILFMALPLTGETEGMFGEAELQAAQGKVIVNVGRGELIQEQALYNALVNGVLRGAALDVWYSYPKDGEEQHCPSHVGIHRLPNLVCSPHIAGFTPQAVESNLIETISSLRAYFAGQPMQNECNLQLLY